MFCHKNICQYFPGRLRMLRLLSRDGTTCYHSVLKARNFMPFYMRGLSILLY